MIRSHKHQTPTFSLGASVNLDLYASEHGMTAVVTAYVGNPFNHGEEIVENRPETAKIASDHFKCEPNQMRYIEQVGQHFQLVPLERTEGGEIRQRSGMRPFTVFKSELDEEIRKHIEPSVGQELVAEPGWASYLKYSKTPPR